MDDGRSGNRVVHALFQPRYAGDDALPRLAGLRFAQHGLAAELYADTPDDLDRLLPYVPPHPRRPTVHLNRGLNLLRERDRGLVEQFAARLAGRLSGMVVHDQAGMGEPANDPAAALRDLDTRLGRIPGAPPVFLEYAAGLEPARFVELAEQLKDAERVSCCIDVGHVGIRRAAARFARGHPDIGLRSLSPSDARLPGLVPDVQDAVTSAVHDVQDMTRAIGRLGKHVHFHLHDGHPLAGGPGGLADHFTFLMRLPIPFTYQGRQSLATLYGPGGLAAIVATAAEACTLDRVSFTLEIHQVEGREPLGDAEGLFRHWPDKANGERLNHWLSVLAGNAMLVEQAIPPGSAA
jgi:hypothetical protein